MTAPPFQFHGGCWRFKAAPAGTIALMGPPTLFFLVRRRKSFFRPPCRFKQVGGRAVFVCLFAAPLSVRTGPSFFAPTLWEYLASMGVCPCMSSALFCLFDALYHLSSQVPPRFSFWSYPPPPPLSFQYRILLSDASSSTRLIFCPPLSKLATRL